MSLSTGVHIKNTPETRSLVESDSKEAHEKAEIPSNIQLEADLDENLTPEERSKSTTGAIQVYLRVRPYLERELEHGARSCLIVDEADGRVQLADSNPVKTFVYDHVAGENSTQEDVFRRVGKPICDQCLNGFNGTVFAYGQTGSGKTYTIGARRSPSNEGTSGMGTAGFTISRDDGLMPRVFSYLFDQIDRRTRKSGGKLHFLVRLSFLEIYNDKIFDLLDGSAGAGNTGGTSSGTASGMGGSLLLREDIKRGMYVEGLNEETVRTANDCMTLVLQGLANRRVGETLMNRESSRSHCILSLTIQSTEICREGAKIERFSRFNLVDLAGSERQRGTGAQGTRLKEAGQINKSLSDLGNVINALALVSQAKQTNEAGVPTVVGNAAIRRHIPYRNSKLTHLLKDSLGGNSLTVLIACVSPAVESFSETLSTLMFAARAKRVRNRVRPNEDVSGTSDQLQKENAVLREEIRMLKQKLTERLEAVLVRSPMPTRNAQSMPTPHRPNDPKLDPAADFGFLSPSKAPRRVTFGATPRRLSRGPTFVSTGSGDGSGGFGLDSNYPWEKEDVAAIGRWDSDSDSDEQESDADDDLDNVDRNPDNADNLLVDYIGSNEGVVSLKRKRKRWLEEPGEDSNGPFIPVSDAQVLLAAVRESALRERDWIKESEKLRQRVNMLQTLRDRLEQTHMNDSMALSMRKNVIDTLTEALEKKVSDTVTEHPSASSDLTELLAQVLKYVREEEPLLRENYINHPQLLDKQIELERVREQLAVAHKRYNFAKQFVCDKALLTEEEAKQFLTWSCGGDLSEASEYTPQCFQCSEPSECKHKPPHADAERRYLMEPNLRQEWRCYAALVHNIRLRQRLQKKYDKLRSRISEKPLSIWQNDWSEEQRQRIRDFDARTTGCVWVSEASLKRLERDVAVANSKLAEYEILLAAKTSELDTLREAQNPNPSATAAKLQRQTELISALEARVAQLVQVNAELVAKLKSEFAKAAKVSPGQSVPQTDATDSTPKSSLLIELDTLKAQYAQQNVTILELSQELEASKARESDLQQECELMRRETQDHASKSLTLAAEVERLNDECELLHQTLLRYQLDRNNAAAEAIVPQNQPEDPDIAKVKEENQRIRLLATDLNAKLIDAQQRAVHLQYQLDAANQLHTEGQTQISELIEQLALRDQANAALRDDLNSAVQARQELSRKVRDLTIELETAKETIAAQESEMRNSFGAQIRSLEARLSVAERAAAEAREIAAADRAAKEEALARVEELVNTHKDHSASIAEHFKTRISELEGALKNEQATNSRLRLDSQQERQRLSTQLEALQKRATCAEVTSQELTERLEQSAREHEALRKQLDEANNAITDLQNQLEQTQAEHSKLNDMLRRANQDAASAIAQAKLAEAEESLTQERLQRAEEELANLRELNLRAESEIAALKRTNAQAEEQIVALSGHQNPKQRIMLLQQLKQENNELKDKVAALEARILNQQKNTRSP